MILTHISLFKFIPGATLGEPPPAPTPDQSTPGFIGRTIRDSYEEWERRQPQQRRPQTDDAVERVRLEYDRLREYTEKADKLNAAIAKVRGDTAALQAETATLRSRITELAKKDRAAAAAKAEKALLIKEQALQLARAQEAMLLEQLEVLDVGYVAVMAYMVAAGVMPIN